MKRVRTVKDDDYHPERMLAAILWICLYAFAGIGVIWLVWH